jgi:hypothetical protein
MFIAKIIFLVILFAPEERHVLGAKHGTLKGCGIFRDAQSINMSLLRSDDHSDIVNNYPLVRLCCAMHSLYLCVSAVNHL